MGYSTDFTGSFELDKPLTPEDLAVLAKINDTRHEPNRDYGGNPDAEFPGYYCQWEVTARNPQSLKWDGGEKFYNYSEWLEYLLERFFAPRGYVLNGEVTWSGEDPKDVGCLSVKDNVLTVKSGVIHYVTSSTSKRAQLLTAIEGLSDDDIEGVVAILGTAVSL
jgi:hypothetical protein